VIRRLLALLLLLAAAPGLAHQAKMTITTVSHNPRTGMIEIAHQVPLHDAEHALVMQGVKSADIIASEASREAFARYVTRRFLIAVDGTIIAPEYVGSAIEGGNLWVYQETPAPQAGGDDANTRVRVNSQILTDFWARQENRVNIGRGTQVTTFVFHAGDEPREAMLAGRR
jgi:hypothetical protein